MVQFTDETLRAGPQSLWATRMNTRSMLEVSPLINAVGFGKTCVVSGASFETAVRFLNDDPWERMRLLRSNLHDTSIEVLIRSRNLFGWSRYPDEVVELLFDCLQRAGTDTVKIFDGLNDISNIAAHCKIAKRLGLKVAGMITFSLSPFHTDEHFAEKASEYMRLGVDTIIVADASGIMTGSRTHTLFSTLKHATQGRVPLEFYAHTSLGLANESYKAALEAGVVNVTTAALPVANGVSAPATIDIARIAADLGLDVPLDIDAVHRLDDYMCWVTYRENKPVGSPITFDPLAYDRFIEHQIPGGMMSNFRNQLQEAGLNHRIDEVLHEAGRVRAELGYPVMVTPFSQFVGVQAVLNIVNGERYKTSPDEVRLYAQGYYGRSGAPIDENVLDRIFNGREFKRSTSDEIFEAKILDKFRIEHGPFKSDEQLLLHLFYGRPSVETMEKNKTSFLAGANIKKPLHILIEELAKQSNFRSINIRQKSSNAASPMCLAMDYI